MSKSKKYIAICTIVLFSIHVLGFEATYAAISKLNMSYLYSYNNNYSAYSNLENQTQNSLNEVAFNFFGINADGSLKLPSSVSIQSFVDNMHNQGIQVIPHLSNDWDSALGISALQNRSMLSSQIADAIIKYDLDGVNLDIENLNKNYASDYTDFVRLLRQKLPIDKKISVAVAANPYNITSGWVGLYDYAGLAAYCDYLMIMAYDEHYKNGAAGPNTMVWSLLIRSARHLMRQSPFLHLIRSRRFATIPLRKGPIPFGMKMNNPSKKNSPLCKSMISREREAGALDKRTKVPGITISSGSMAAILMMY